MAEPMNEREQAISDEIRATVTGAMTGSERSQQSQDKRLGISDLGHCRNYARLMIENVPFSDTQDNYQSAFNGTAIGDLIEKHLPHETQGEVRVTIPMRDGYSLTLTGHPDIIRRDDTGKVVAVHDLKGLALDTPIPTPTGWTTMDEVQVGDTVIDKDGQPTTVTEVSPIKRTDCYEVLFNNRHAIIADADHRWVAARKNQANVKMTEVLTAHLSDYKVPVAGVLDLPDVELPEDPWAVGYWLGNGHHKDSMVTCHGDDAEEVAVIAETLGFTALMRWHSDRNSATVSFGRKGAGHVEGVVGFSKMFNGVKRVPEKYMRSGIKQREALLAGLMDSDGCWNIARNRVVFSSTDYVLSSQVAELARSLGQRVQFNSHEAHGFGKTVTAYPVEWTPTFNPFRPSRKSAKWREPKSRTVNATYKWHSVRAVSEVPSVPTKCIAVDSPSETYLAGEAMIPTHNSKSGLSTIRKYGISKGNKFQVTAYGKALIDAGEADPDNLELALIYVDRSGDDPQPHVVSWQWNQEDWNEIVAWLDDVIEALVTGQDAPKDMPRDAFCANYCPMFTTCRANDTDVTGLITQPEYVNAVEAYLEGGRLEKQGKQLKKEASSFLQNATGNVRTSEGVKSMRWVHVNASASYVKRPSYDRLSITKMKQQ